MGKFTELNTVQLHIYIYHIDGGEKRHFGYQDLSYGDIVKNHPQLLVPGAKFVVEYWLDNPDRSIIYIDKPVNDTISVPSRPDMTVLRPIWDSIPVVLPNHK
jgi:hypothetical protein